MYDYHCYEHGSKKRRPTKINEKQTVTTNASMLSFRGCVDNYMCKVHHARSMLRAAFGKKLRNELRSRSIGTVPDCAAGPQAVSCTNPLRCLWWSAVQSVCLTLTCDEDWRDPTIAEPLPDAPARTLTVVAPARLWATRWSNFKKSQILELACPDTCLIQIDQLGLSKASTPLETHATSKRVASFAHCA